MREKTIERKLVEAVKSRGGICPKWVAPGFVEVKAPGEKPRALQLSRHRLLDKLGFHTYILDDVEQIGGILDEIQST